MNRAEKCINEIQNWMNACFLKLNPDKTMLKIFNPVNPNLRQDITNLSLKVGPAKEIQPSLSIKILGVTIGETMDFSEFIATKIRSCNNHLRNLWNIRLCLPRKTRILLVNNLVLSNLDFCNSLLIGLPECRIKPLQKIMNRAVRFICNVNYRDHISPFLFDLHFLPVRYRIKFKVCLILYKIVKGVAPIYLTENFQLYKPTINLNLRPGSGRDILMLEINLNQRKKNTLYTHFIIEWNALPYNLRKIDNIDNFKAHLKAHFFKQAFNQYM